MRRSELNDLVRPDLFLPDAYDVVPQNQEQEESQ